MKKTPVRHKMDVETSPEVKQTKQNVLPFILVGALVLIFIVLKIARGNSLSLNDLKSKVIPGAVEKVITPGTKFQIGAVKETNGLVEFELTVNSQKYTSYISRDGKILFTTGIKLDELKAPQGNNSGSGSSKTATCNDIKKSDSEKLTAFVVSNCPFGLQMQRVFKKAIAEAPALSDYIDVKYIGAISDGKITSMHGDEEAKENLRQICIREEQSDKYWPYVSCYMQEGKDQECLTTANVNTSQLDACVADSGRGLKYAQADFDVANKFSVSGSPTLLSNNQQIVSEFDFGGRNPEATKQLICCGSNTKPSFCSQALSKDDVAVSLSKSDEAPANTASGAGSGCAPAK